MIEGQVVDGLFVLSRTRQIELDRAKQERNCVLKLGYSAVRKIDTDYDVSGKGNHGTITGATWVRLPSGLWVLNFDGVDDYVDAGGITFFDLATPCVEAWVRMSADTTGDIFSKFDSVNGDAGFILRYNTTGTKFEFFAGWTSGPASSAAISLDTWYHVVGLHVASPIRTSIYVNGVIGTNGATPVSPVAMTTKLFIGIRADLTNDLNGRLALRRVYNTPLTVAQIASHYNQERHLFNIK